MLSTSHSQRNGRHMHPHGNHYRLPVHQIEQEEPECSAVDDTFYVDGMELVDICVDTVFPQAEVRDKGFVTIQTHNEPIEIKFHTGAKCNVISIETFNKISSGQIVKSSKTTNLVAVKATWPWTQQYSQSSAQHTHLSPWQCRHETKQSLILWHTKVSELQCQNPQTGFHRWSLHTRRTNKN